MRAPSQINQPLVKCFMNCHFTADGKSILKNSLNAYRHSFSHTHAGTFPLFRLTIVYCSYRGRGIPTHLLGAQPNGRQEQHQQQLNDNDHNSSDTSVEDSKLQFQNNLRKFKAKCDNELEKLLEKCESRRRSTDRKFFNASESGAVASRPSLDSALPRTIRRLESSNASLIAGKDDDENGTWIAAYDSDCGLLIWAIK